MSRQDNINAAVQALFDRGLPANAVAGILGHIQQESDFNPTLVDDHGSSFGLFQVGSGAWNQWSSYARANGIAPSDVGQQARYMVDMMARVTPTAFNRLVNAGSPRDALNAWRQWNYWGLTGDRYQFANQWRDALGAGDGNAAHGFVSGQLPNDFLTGLPAGADPAAAALPDWMTQANAAEPPFSMLPEAAFHPFNPAPNEAAFQPLDTWREPSLPNPAPNEASFTPTDSWRYSNPAPNEQFGLAPVESFRTAPDFFNLVPNEAPFQPMDNWRSPDLVNPAPNESAFQALDTWREPDPTNPAPNESAFQPLDTWREPDPANPEPSESAFQPIDMWRGPDDAGAVADFNAADSQLGAGMWYYDAQGNIVPVDSGPTQSLAGRLTAPTFNFPGTGALLSDRPAADPAALSDYNDAVDAYGEGGFGYDAQGNIVRWGGGPPAMNRLFGGSSQSLLSADAQHLQDMHATNAGLAFALGGGFDNMGIASHDLPATALSGEDFGGGGYGMGWGNMSLGQRMFKEALGWFPGDRNLKGEQAVKMHIHPSAN